LLLDLKKSTCSALVSIGSTKWIGLAPDPLFPTSCSVGIQTKRLDWLHHLLMGVRILFKNTLEAYSDNYLQYKLSQLLQEHRVVSLITLLRDSVFCENTEPRSIEGKQRRAKQTFDEMMNYIPDFFVKCIGEEAKYEGIRLLFEGLQQPVLNKQLTYVLLDIVLQELFPELSKVQKEGTSTSMWK
ncbi:hypothetical protein scyTo_0018066, partial [Scyliorhinus torazame]|nr:hypothetical protein [Scyliorhinus torazame]